MSRIADVSRQYHEALRLSGKQYDELLAVRLEAAEIFYRDFFHRLVRRFADDFKSPRYRARLQERIRRQRGTDTLQFVAIDGTCRREMFADWVTFFGGAYGARGEIRLQDGEHRIAYRRWSLDQDVSLVAWVPIPFARMDEVDQGTEEAFIYTDDERVNLSNVHTRLMQLAEIYLAYNMVRSSRLDAPHILMLDMSPSSVLASVARDQDQIGLVGYPYDRRQLTAADITVALAHPFSAAFGIPSAKTAELHRLILHRLHEEPERDIDLESIAKSYGVSLASLRGPAQFLEGRGVIRQKSYGVYAPQSNVRQSWMYVNEVFQNICTRLFLDKDPTALQYEVTERGKVRKRWMAPNDLGFLIGVGLRLLIEACWERNVLLYGVVKDSLSRYLTRNYLGVALETGLYPELRDLRVGPLPWTDRMFCEVVPLVDDSLDAPWATIEFDSAFMTLHRERQEDGQTTVAGVMGGIVNQEKILVRSLGQFFLKRRAGDRLMGHVVFLERLLLPGIDVPGSAEGPREIMISSPKLGRFSVYAWPDANAPNWGQAVMMYLLSVLTRNHYAEAIGYPDPLHKADWGAKTVGRFAGGMIQSAQRELDTRPLARTFRHIRNSRNR